MKTIKMILLMLVSICSQSVFSQVPKPPVNYDKVNEKGIVLLPNTGLTDPVSGSSANLYGSMFAFIHGDANATGYYDINFLQQGSSTTNPLNFYSQINIGFGNLTINKPFNVRVNLIPNLAKDSKAICYFYVQLNNDVDPPAFIKTNPVMEKDTSFFFIVPGNQVKSTIFYIRIWGFYSNTNLSYELDKIVLSYPKL